MNTFMKIALGIGAAVVGVKIVIAITEDKTTVDEPSKPVKEVVKEKVNQAVNYAVNNADKIQGAVMLLGLFSTIIELATNLNKLYSVKVMNTRLTNIENLCKTRINDTYWLGWNNSVDEALKELQEAAKKNLPMNLVDKDNTYTFEVKAV